MRSDLDHKITDDSLVEIFYRALDDNNKAVVDTITRDSFLDCTFVEVVQRLERVATTNRAWGMRDTETTKSFFSISTNPEQANINHKVLKELARINTHVGLLIKQNQE